MKLRRCLLLLLVLGIAGSPAARAETAQLSWKVLSQKLQSRVDKGLLGNDVRVSFQNCPLGDYKAEELMAYTMRGDGWVVIQMRNKVKELKVSPAELIWLSKFLLEHNLGDFPEQESPADNSASYGIIISIEGHRKSIQLYNLLNDVDREIVWQYLFRLGQLILTEVGLRDKAEPLLPVCKGVVGYTEIDSNNDRRAEWLRLELGFYSFKPGDYTVNFGGYRQNIFLSQGNSIREFALNTYLLSSPDLQLKEYLQFAINSPGDDPLKPYKMDLGLDSYLYKLNVSRLQPDLFFKGSGRHSFRLGLDQTVFLGVKRNDAYPDEVIHRFSISGIAPGEVRLGPGEGEGQTIKVDDNEITLDFYGCISSALRLKAIEGNYAVFETGWNIPDKDLLKEKISDYRDYIASGKFKDNEESLKFSIGYYEECLGDLRTLDDLAVRVIYSQPSTGEMLWENGS
ncbi:MAG: hypothetical protein PHH68_04820 [Candidatus Omnitrophica bacterium]|jgi:hypothetical protein|nr:hypothetical protein [Candidatus Omnitrophota bacterium]MDD5079633.1 hypothetical protein [Candidatus Omnitrophota bacterium]